MTKYHINPTTGNPGICRAEHQCPYGDLEEDHYQSRHDARAAYEDKMAQYSIRGTKGSQVMARNGDSLAVGDYAIVQLYGGEEFTSQKVEDLSTHSGGIKIGGTWVGASNIVSRNPLPTTGPIPKKVGRELLAQSRSLRVCPECGQTGRGQFCYHWDATGERKILTQFAGDMVQSEAIEKAVPIERMTIHEGDQLLFDGSDPDSYVVIDNPTAENIEAALAAFPSEANRPGPIASTAEQPPNRPELGTLSVGDRVKLSPPNPPTDGSYHREWVKDHTQYARITSVGQSHVVAQYEDGYTDDDGLSSIELDDDSIWTLAHESLSESKQDSWHEVRPDYAKIASQLTERVEHGTLGQVTVDQAYAQENKDIELAVGTQVGEKVWVGEGVDGLTIPARTREEIESYLNQTYWREEAKGTFE